MISRAIDFSLRQPLYVAGGVATLVATGLYAYSTLPFEAFPDLTANSVSVIADTPGMAPSDVEQLVTYPIERSLLGLPRTESVRSTTKFGLAMTQVIFDDGVDPYFARQVVAERLNDLGGDLPQGASVAMGPVATAMGEIYQYALVSDDPKVTPWDLKTLQDYTIAPQLRTVSGVAEVNSWGGLIEQFHVIVEPGRLIQAGITLADVERALAENNRNFGGTYTEARGERFVVRGEGRLVDLASIEDVAVDTRDGVPIHIHDIATVTRGSLPRQGAVTLDGGGEVVAGMVIMRKGANALRVLERVQARMDDILPTLPAGVRLVTFYDQGSLVEQTTATIQKNLLLGGTLVVILLLGLPAQPDRVLPRRTGHPALDALGLHLDADLRLLRQPDEPRCARLRTPGRRLRGGRRERHAEGRRRSWSRPGTQRGQGGGAAGPLRDRDHHRRLHSDPRATGNRG